jgi:hypothetical protein
VYYSFHRTAQTGSNQNRIEGEVGGPGAQLSRRTSTIECLVLKSDASQVLNWQLY